MSHRTRSQRPYLRAVAPLVGDPVVAVAPVALPGAPRRRAGVRVEFPTWGRVVQLGRPDVAADDDLAEVVGFCFQVLATPDDRGWRTYG